MLSVNGEHWDVLYIHVGYKTKGGDREEAAVIYCNVF